MPRKRYRVFVGPHSGARVFHAYATTKSEAFEILHQHINAKELAKMITPDQAREERTILLAHKARVLKERAMVTPAGLHLPLFTCRTGSICTL